VIRHTFSEGIDLLSDGTIWALWEIEFMKKPWLIYFVGLRVLITSGSHLDHISGVALLAFSRILRKQF
jgi:hypothetical protein